MNWRSLAIHGMVGLVAMGALALSQVSTPADWHEGGRDAEREEVARQYWLRIEDRAQEAREHEQLALGNADNREGGRHRRALSIGEGSKGIKSKNLFKKVRNVILAIIAIWIGAGIAGAILNRVGSPRHARIVGAAVRTVMPVLGTLPKLA